MKRPTREPSQDTDGALADSEARGPGAPTPEQVAEYLRTDPDFFSRFPDLLEELYLPHESGAAISLITRQVEVLRDRNIDMRSRLSSLSRTARDNDGLFAKTRALILDAIEAADAPALTAIVVGHLRREFAVEHVTLQLFDDDHSAAATATRDRAEAAIGHLLQADQPIAGHLRDTELDFLFPGATPPPGSAAAVALRADRLLGVLALGSPEADRFTPAMGTLFLRFTAEIVSRLIVRLQRPAC